MMPPPKDRQRLRQLHAMLGSSNAAERENAWNKVDEWLRKHGKTWNDLPELLHDETAPSRTDPRVFSGCDKQLKKMCVERDDGAIG